MQGFCLLELLEDRGGLGNVLVHYRLRERRLVHLVHRFRVRLRVRVGVRVGVRVRVRVSCRGVPHNRQVLRMAVRVGCIIGIRG